MADDIRIYDFNLNLLYILPPRSPDGGYRSMNAKEEFCANGSLELVYTDESLKKLVSEQCDNLIVRWRSFCGFVTSFVNTQTECRIMGMALNGLLHRAVIPAKDVYTGRAETLVRSAIGEAAPWLELGSAKGLGISREHEATEYMHADEYVKKLMEKDGGGYRITADFARKKLVFECLAPNMSNLMISGAKHNAYDFQTTYSNKELAFGGWYKKEIEYEEPVWTYISQGYARTGIYKIDTVLAATTEDEAKNELAAKCAEYDITAKTRDIYYGTDYALGDVVRVQDDGKTVRKIVTSVSMWQEASYGEEPTFGDWEDSENG